MKRMVWVAVCVLAVPVAGQEVTTVPGDNVAVYDLAGRVSVVRGTGSDVVVRVRRGGADAGSLRIETGELRGRSTLRVVFPGDEIVYPEMGRGSSSSLSVRDDGTFGDDGDGRGDRVRIRGSGSGLEAWADLVVEVPPGRTLSVYLGVGQLEATDVEARLRFDTSSGPVTASGITGTLDIDTGSGHVDVRGVRGSLRVDTGSGGVSAADVNGDTVELDTGSGGVDVNEVQTPRLSVDTGSGRVSMKGVSAPEVLVDTGSGGVDIELLVDVDRLDVDTGSGRVVIRAPSDLGGMVEIDTGSGGIDLDFPLEVSSVRRDRVQGRLGDGDGTIRIETGSGSIRILRLTN